MSPRPAEYRAPPTLVAAVVLIWVMVTAEIVFVGWRSEWTIGLRVMVALILSLQLLMAQLALRLSAGAFLSLFAFEAMTIVGAIGSDAPVGVRILLAIAAIATIALLSLSMSAFPSPSMPRGPLP